ncbi:hypothetical protein T09_13986 [Trichinella sp. T9]|nr:hypothetical protein T09_13986 [Trichinella sp. T9]
MSTDSFFTYEINNALAGNYMRLMHMMLFPVVYSLN